MFAWLGVLGVVFGHGSSEEVIGAEEENLCEA